MKYQGTITHLSSSGNGVLKTREGKTFYVLGGIPGEVVEIIAETNFAEVPVNKIIKSSEHRRKSPCPHFGFSLGECSGCPWIEFSYDAQIQLKTSRLKFLLEKNKIAFSKPIKVSPSKDEFFYRSRVQLKSDGERIGYVSRASHELAPISECMVLSEKLQKKISSIKLDERFAPPEQYRFSLVEFDESTKEITPNEKIKFSQANQQQNEYMKSWLRDKLPKCLSVLELYCGSGNFTEVIGQKVSDQLLCVEYPGQALETLAKRNIPRVKTLGVDLNNKDSFHRIYDELKIFDLLFLDPPREGFESRDNFFQVFQFPRYIAYVSCNPLTWSRDAKSFLAHGYRLKEIEGVDQFPQTSHLEILSLFEKDV